MYQAKKSTRTAKAQGKSAYVYMAVVLSGLGQRNLCIEQIILNKTKTFTKVCLTHACDTEGLCASVSLVSEVIFESSGVVKLYILLFVVVVFCFPALIILLID